VVTYLNGEKAVDSAQKRSSEPAGGVPTDAQQRYLEQGLNQPGGKLPLFDREGRAIPYKTIETCIAHGWAEPWFANPVKPDWLVCKLTPAGYRVLGRIPPARDSQAVVGSDQPG